ncbi:MAG: OmpA family protein [Gallionella sp.]
MKKPAQKLICTLLACLPVTLLAESALPQNLEQIVALQRRADTLAYGSIGADNYHLAKARIWLDLATSEYHQTDTSGVLPAAITQAETLITSLENRTAIHEDMLTNFPGSEKVRTDLWDKVATIKGQGSYTCGQRPLAEAEVQLVWAGHEKIESGWNHAEPYAKIADDSIKEAQAAIDICNGKATVTAKPVVAPVVTPIVETSKNTHRVIEKITLSADTLFDFDKTSLTRYSKSKLDDLMRNLAHVTSLDSVSLVGHSDRLRNDGKLERNQKLSEKRAQRIKEYLISKGMPSNMISAQGVGSQQPVVECSSTQSKAEQVVCLQPNRRVEITLRGVR